MTDQGRALDEMAVYPTALTELEVSLHFHANH